MKFAARFLTLLATAAAIFAGCQQEEADYELPSIKIDGQFTVDSETKKASFEAGPDLTVLSLSVTATRDWAAEIEWDADEVPWIAVTPEKGLASDAPQAVKVTILDNAGYNRTKQIKFSINYDYKTLYLTQTGEKGEEIVGTLENPFTVAGAIKYVKTLGSDVQSPELMYVKGKISQIADAGTFTEGGTFGNATFYISDDGSTSGDQFYCYRILYLGNQKFQAGQTDIKVGDEVIICGKLVNYKGNTPETVQGSAFLYELNGKNQGGAPTPSGDAKGTGTVDDPYNPAAANAAVAGLTWTDNNTYDKTGDVYVKGKISRIASNGTFTEGGTYGNASFYISEDGTTSGEFYAFRILYLGNKKFTAGQTDIKVGDEVVICGKLMNYRGNTPETVAGEAYLYSLNGKSEGGGSQGGGETSDVKAVTIAEFNAAPESQTQVYELVGTIGGSINTTYGNFDLTDDSGTVYVYGLTATNLGYGATNDKSYGSLGLNEGDKIKIQGYRGSYKEKIEVLYPWFIEKVTEGGGGGGGETTGSSVSFETNSGAETWAAETDGTYGVGFSSTTQGVKVGYYKHKSSSNSVAPNDKEVRIYKNSALVITAPSGKTIKKIVMTTAGTGSGQYCLDMTGLEGAANATADVSSLSVTWTGSASKVALQAEKGQVRMVKLTLELE